MDNSFPPTLCIGSRVWTEYGYKDHGPIEGPRIDIAARMGGTVDAISRPYGVFSDLYTVRWDNGQVSKHYATGLFCIGNYETRSAFESAIRVIGPVELTIGPQGGFREVKLQVEYAGHRSLIHLHDRDLWVTCLQGVAERDHASISVRQLEPKKPRRPSPFSEWEPTVLKVKLTDQLKEKLMSMSQILDIPADKLVRSWIEEKLTRKK